MRRFVCFVIVLVAAGSTTIAGAADRSAAVAPRLLVGAAEDSAKAATLAQAKAQMDLAALAGMNAIRLTAQWSPGLLELPGGQLVGLRNAVDAASLDGIDVFLSVYPYGSSVTPLTSAAQTQFATFAASLARALPTVHRFIVGNEPNLNRFWLPQFDAQGGDAAAVAYEALLARTYDALKAASPAAVVIGGSVAPRGSDLPGGGRPTHSPTAFIADLGAAYRASGRTKPIMDAFSFHPYEENSSLPPTFAHPRSTTIALADYGKLVSLLGQAFDGTAQPGSRLPIVYDEFGVQSTIPSAKASGYAGAKPISAKPVTESVQGLYYAEALALAACQPTVSSFLIFHVTDEPDLDRWQSGVFYADGTPKPSMRILQRAIASLRTGGLTGCGTDAVQEFAQGIALGSG
jgi:hypothetical protein